MTASDTLDTTALNIAEYCRGAHHGQVDLTLVLIRDGERLGHLHYSVYEGIPHIQMIEVEPNHRRRGHGLRLLADLQRRYPDQEIEWGSLTSDGMALKSACPVRFEPTPEAPAFARLGRLIDRLKGMERQVAEAFGSEKPSRDLITAYYCLERHVETLREQLDDKASERAILVPELD